VQRLLALIGPLPFIALAILAAGLSLGVAVGFFDGLLAPALNSLPPGWRYPLTGLALAASYFVYGLTLLLLAPLLNFILGGRLQPYRGSAVSLTALRWYVHCTLTLVVRYSFLEFVTPSPFAQLYYRLMGMKIGRNVTINSTAIADPSLIEMADGVTIGGSASVMAHYAQSGYLVIAPVRLGAAPPSACARSSWGASTSVKRPGCWPVPSSCPTRVFLPAKPGPGFPRGGSISSGARRHPATASAAS
jgi:hypothetical protein